jgi:hypothetical protein
LEERDMKKGFPLVVLFGLLACPALARDLKVPNPLRTLEKAMDRAKAGDVIHVAAGTYKEFVQMKTGVTLMGAGAEKTILTPPDEGGCPLSISGARDVWVDGFTISAGDGSRAVDGHTASFTLSNCILHGNMEGVGLRDCFLTVIRNNRFRNNQTAIKMVNAFPTIQRNIFEGGSGSIYAVVARSSAPFIVQNVFRGGQWGVMYSRSTNRGIQPPILRSNVFVHLKKGGLWVEGGAGLIARNNILVGMDTGFYADGSKPALSHNNLFQVKKPYIAIGKESGEEEAFEPNPGVGELAVDPLFTDPEKGDFRLKEGSPCAGTGIRTPAEPAETKADMGCFPDGKPVEIGPMQEEEKRLACKPQAGVMIANNVAEEYITVQNTPCPCFGRYGFPRQALVQKDGRPFDVLTAPCGNCKKERKFEFDISRFFGEMFLVRKKK